MLPRLFALIRQPVGSAHGRKHASIDNSQVLDLESFHGTVHARFALELTFLSD